MKALEIAAVMSVALVTVWASSASATPVTVYSENLDVQDVLEADGRMDELGDAFPPDEDIYPCTVEWGGHYPCLDEYTGNGAMKQVKIINQTDRDFGDVHYVADPETTLTNYDGKIGNAGQDDAWLAFRIDDIGLNTPLVGESMDLDGVFQAGEAWVFVIQDYRNTLGLPAHLLGSAGIASMSSDEYMSSGSIIAIPEPATMALLALGGVGILFRRRRRHNHNA